MFKVDEFVVYKGDVCKIKAIKNINNIMYYVLSPIEDETLIINTPQNNNLIRKIITKEKSLKLINSIPNIDIIKTYDKLIENEYKNLLNSGKLEDLVKIIKTTYLRNEDRINNKRKIS